MPTKTVKWDMDDFSPIGQEGPGGPGGYPPPDDDGEGDDPLDDLEQQDDKPPEDRPDPGNIQDQPKAKDRTVQPQMPKYNVNDLLRKFFETGLHNVSTYSKLPLQVGSAISVAAQTGAAKFPPGERSVPAEVKLGLVFDCSGSMQHAIPKTLGLGSQIMSALDSAIVAFGLFNGGTKLYWLDLKKDQAWLAKSWNEDPKNPSPGTQIYKGSDIKKQALSGGMTIFAKIAPDCQTLLSKGYNICIFTDSDIGWENNWKAFSALLKAAGSRVFVVCDNRKTWLELIKKPEAQGFTEHFTYIQ